MEALTFIYLTDALSKVMYGSKNRLGQLEYQ